MATIPRHQCMVYAGAPSAHLADVAQTLLERLRANYRCLYLNSRPMVVGMRWHLASSGLDLSAEIARGSLSLSSEQEHLVKGKFNTRRMIATLRDAVVKALDDGYTGLWAAGDMTWEFGNEKNLDKLHEYERQLEAFMQGNPALCGICLYHRDTLPAHAIKTALQTHRAEYVNATLSQLNPAFQA